MYKRNTHNKLDQRKKNFFFRFYKFFFIDKHAKRTDYIKICAHTNIWKKSYFQHTDKFKTQTPTNIFNLNLSMSKLYFLLRIYKILPLTYTQTHTLSHI